MEVHENIVALRKVKFRSQPLRCRCWEERMVFLTRVSVIQPGQVVRADLSQAGSQAGVLRVGAGLFNPHLSAVAWREWRRPYIQRKDVMRTWKNAVKAAGGETYLMLVHSP